MVRVTLKEIRQVVLETWTEVDALRMGVDALNALRSGNEDGVFSNLQGAVTLLGGLSADDWQPGEREFAKALSLLRRGEARVDEVERLIQRGIASLDPQSQEPGDEAGYRDSEDQGDHLDRVYR